MNMDHDLEKCLHYLQEGGIILYPTDTVWGIGCDATDAEAVERIFALKKRAEEKTMIVLMNEDMLQAYVGIDILPLPAQAERPVTIVFPNARGLAKNVIAGDGSIAIRVPDDLFCNQLIRMYNRPIVSTSANFSGTATPRIFDEISEEIKNGVDYVVRHRQHETEPSAPSMIYKIEADGSYTLLRG